MAMYMAAKRAQVLPKQPGLHYCYDMLNKVSRSFAIVIQQLPERLRDAVCVFYLVLRALDTVEDDMSIPDKVKIPLLRCFHENSYDRTWSMDCGAGHYKDLMANYPIVTDVFLSLDTEYQLVIADICRKMGNGMADFIPQEVETVEQYDLYCHYVAGLVGIGLSQLFASSGLESKEFFKMEDSANRMGLFLQKTNIIRDYLEDINEEPAPRMFWPREIWSQYARRLADLKLDRHRENAVACLNHMILDALSHAEDCMVYMSQLRNPAIFRFCSIPQVMAIATLAACFNNHAVFTGVVKMRRGETAKIMYHLSDFGGACAQFRQYARQISAKAQVGAGDDPHIGEILESCERIENAALKHMKDAGMDDGAALEASRAEKVPVAGRVLMLVAAAFYTAYAWQVEEVRTLMGLPRRSYVSSMDYLNRVVAAILLGYALVVAVIGRRLAA